MTKNNRFYISLVLLLLLWIVFSFFYITGNFRRAQENKELRALKVATTAEVSLYGEMIKELKALPGDVNTLAYQSLKKRLSEFSEIDNEIAFAYLLSKKNNDIYFLVDSEPVDSEDYSAAGDLFYEADWQIYHVFEKKEPLVTEPAKDRWGNWVSVLVPMIDDDGKVLAVFGIDYSADTWYSEAYTSIFNSSLISFFVLLLIISLYFIDKNRRKFSVLSKDYKRITDNISDVIWTSDLNFNINYVSPSIYNITGHSVKEHLEKSLEEKFNNESIEKIQKTFKEELKKEKQKKVDKNRSVILEVEQYRKDKSLFWSEMTVKFIRNKNGEAIGLQGLTRDITERRILSEQIKESEEKFRLISENSPVVVFQFNPKGKAKGSFSYISPQVKAITGFSRSEFLGDYSIIHKRILKKYRADFENEMEKSIKNKSSFKFKMEFKKKNGEIAWFDLKAKAGLIKGKAVLNGVFIDISKEKELEFKLKNETERLIHIIEGANVGTWETNLETKEVIINEKWAEILGYDLKSLNPFTMDDWFTYIHPDDLKGVSNEFKNHLDGKTEFFEYEYRMKHKAGNWLWVYGKGKAIVFDKDKKALKVFGTFIDINERKKQEEELLKITKSVEQSPASIVITDVKGNIEYVNPKFEELTGYSFKEAIGQNPRILKTGETLDSEYKEMWQTISSGQNWRGQFYNKKKDGSFFWEAASISPVKNKKGKIINYIAVKEDITEQKKIQEQYKTLVANLPGVAFRCLADKNWTMKYISHYIEELSGYKASDFIDNKNIAFADIIYKEDKDYVGREIDKAIKKASDYEIEYRIETKDKQIKWVKEKAKLLKEANKIKYLDGIIFDITEEKRINDQINESKKRYDDLSKQSRTFIWEVDKNAKYTYVSENVKDIIGYSASEIINKKTVFDLHPKEGRAEFKKSVMEVLKKKQSIQLLENKLVAKDKSIVWVSSSGMPVLDKAGKLVKFTGLDMDISAKKKVEEKVRASLEQQKFLSKITTELSQYTNFEASINQVLKDIAQFTNSDRVYIFENSLDGAHTSNTFEYCAEKIKPEIKNLQNIAWSNIKEMHKQLQKNDVFNINDIEKLPKAEKKFLSSQDIKSILALPIKIAGQHFGFIGLDQVKTKKDWQDTDIYLMEMIAKTISSVYEKEANLREIISALNDFKTEKEKIETIVQGIGDGVFVLNKNLEIILFNKQAEKISGFKREEVINKKYDEVLKFYDEKSNKKNDQFIIDTFEKGKIQKMTNHTVLIRKDKEKVAVADSSAPIWNKNKEIIACVVVFRDVSEEREVDKIKSEFVSVVSHQLKTPLTGIKWMSELLLEDDFGQINKDQKEFIDNIYSSNQRMIKLVNDLLDVSHIETGRKFDIKKKKTDLVKIVTQVLIDNMALAKEKQVSIIKCEDAPDKLFMKVDASKLEQVFANLINNAIKYSKTKGEVKIACKHSKDKVIFEIKDDGIGIPINQQSRIFSKFFRAENALSSHTDGTGLGLYISKSIVEAHGGELWFESKKNKGTSFFFSLPIK